MFPDCGVGNGNVSVVIGTGSVEISVIIIDSKKIRKTILSLGENFLCMD